MGPEQRRHAIERMLADDPATSQQTIAEACGVSQNTISKDLRALERAGGLNQRQVSRRGRPHNTVVKLQAPSTSAGADLVAGIRRELDAKVLRPTREKKAFFCRSARWPTILPSCGGSSTPRVRRFRRRPRAVCLASTRLLLRSGRAGAVLARLLSQISLEESTKSPVKQKAANTRWRAHQLARAQQAEGADRGQDQSRGGPHRRRDRRPAPSRIEGLYRRVLPVACLRGISHSPRFAITAFATYMTRRPRSRRLR